jgi:hypothetical protein
MFANGNALKIWTAKLAIRSRTGTSIEALSVSDRRVGRKQAALTQ